jgi:ANTAR domain
MTTLFEHLPHQPQLVALLDRVIDRIRIDVPEALGIAIAVQGNGGRRQPQVLASWGIEADLMAAQTGGLGGPVSDALDHVTPVLSLHLWSDDRWPALTAEAVAECAPQRAEVWAQVAGAVAVPGVWGDDASVVLTCTLDRPASAATVATLIGYEQLVVAALVSAVAGSAANMTDVVAVLQSRGAIEQAKGALMGRLGCDAGEAWDRLRQASQHDNVKVRSLAVALVEHIGGQPAEQPSFTEPIQPDERTRAAAKALWASLNGDRE